MLQKEEGERKDTRVRSTACSEAGYEIGEVRGIN